MGTRNPKFSRAPTDSEIKAAVGGGNTAPVVIADTSKTFSQLLSASGLTPGKFYSPSGDDGVNQEKRLFWASKANKAIPLIDGAPRFWGAYTLAQILAIAAPGAGDTALATDIGQAPGLHVIYTGTKWRAMFSFENDDIFRVASSATNAKTADGLWVVSLPAGFHGLFRYVDVGLHYLRSTQDGNNLAATVYLGTAGDDATDTLIASWNAMGSTNTTRTPWRRFKLSGTNSVQVWDNMNVNGVYGGTQGVEASTAAVTIGQTFADALKWSFYVDEAGATSPVTTLSAILKFIP